MLEARLADVAILRHLVDGKICAVLIVYHRFECPFIVALKELVTDANFLCDRDAIVRSFPRLWPTFNI